MTTSDHDTDRSESNFNSIPRTALFKIKSWGIFPRKCVHLKVFHYWTNTLKLDSLLFLLYAV